MSDNTLKRTMKLHHLVIFGVAFLTPMIAYTIYGVIATASHGVESGSICFAVIAMLFTALSYGHMAKAFPAAGSTYTYTRKAINAKLGVVAGWIVLLGYVFFPMAIWLICSCCSFMGMAHRLHRCYITDQYRRCGSRKQDQLHHGFDPGRYHSSFPYLHYQGDH